jgi:glycolate oxidase
MTAIAMPSVDEAVLARRDEIVAGLRAILGEDHVIAAEDECRAYETVAVSA